MSVPLAMAGYWALGAYLLGVLGVLAAMLIVPALVGERGRHDDPHGEYEGGIVSQGSARLRISAHFYLVAMFFVIFDLEAVFIYSWAVAARELGWTGYISILIFVGVLLATLAYLWRVRALEYRGGPRAPKT